MNSAICILVLQCAILAFTDAHSGECIEADADCTQANGKPGICKQKCKDDYCNLKCVPKKWCDGKLAGDVCFRAKGKVAVCKQACDDDDCNLVCLPENVKGKAKNAERKLRRKGKKKGRKGLYGKKMAKGKRKAKGKGRGKGNQ